MPCGRRLFSHLPCQICGSCEACYYGRVLIEWCRVSCVVNELYMCCMVACGVHATLGVRTGVTRVYCCRFEAHAPTGSCVSNNIIMPVSFRRYADSHTYVYLNRSKIFHILYPVFDSLPGRMENCDNKLF